MFFKYATNIKMSSNSFVKYSRYSKCGSQYAPFVSSYTVMVASVINKPTKKGKGDTVIKLQ